MPSEYLDLKHIRIPMQEYETKILNTEGSNMKYTIVKSLNGLVYYVFTKEGCLFC